MWTGDSGEYPGFYNNLKLLKSENWIYNMTPKFDFLFFCTNKKKKFRVYVYKGHIQESDHNGFLVGKSFYQSYLQSQLY